MQDFCTWILHVISAYISISLQFELSCEANPTNCTIIELTCELLKEIWANWVKEDSWKKIDSSGVLHFTDFLRKCQQPREQHVPARKTTFLSAPTTTELHQSGVKFKNPEKGSLFDIRFSNGILEIPQLKIDDTTEILFRNLQAFEQCHYRLEYIFVSEYITFVGCLVRAPNDVEVLARNENLKNMLNSDEAVSNILWSLDKENVVTKNSFSFGCLRRPEVTQSVGTSGRQPWSRFISKIHGLASLFLQLVFFLYPLSYKRSALSFNCDR